MRRKVQILALATLLTFTLCSCLLVQCGANAGTGDFQQSADQEITIGEDLQCGMIAVVLVLLIALVCVLGAGGLG